MTASYILILEIRLTANLTDVEIKEMTKNVLEAIARLVEEGALHSGEEVMTELVDVVAKDGNRTIAAAHQLFWVPTGEESPKPDDLKRGSGRTS